MQELQDKVRRLHQLVSDPHPGLMTWWEAYDTACNDLLAFYGVKPETNIIPKIG